MSNQKKQFKKSVYGTAKHFTNQELQSIINRAKDNNKEAESWMTFDLKNETKNAKMEKNSIRYLQVLVTDLDGKKRPLIRDTAPALTQSKCRLGDTEDGKISSTASFSTRIRIMSSVDDQIEVIAARAALKIDDDAEWAEEVAKCDLRVKAGVFTANQKYIDALIDAMADDTVNEKNPTLSEDQFTEKAKQQVGLIRMQYQQWQVEKAIGAEFERLLNDDAVQESINYTYNKKTHNISSNVSRDRKPKEGDVDEKKLAKKYDNGQIPLEEWMVYYRVRIDTKDGSLWCKIYDVTTPQPPKTPRKLATHKNPETNRVEFLNHLTIESWLRYGTAFTGFCKYQLCITPKGPRLHAAFPELVARRAAKGEGQSRVEEGAVNQLADFGGNFGGDDDDDVATTKPRDDSDSEDEKPKGKKKGLTAIERQMQELDDGAKSD